MDGEFLKYVLDQAGGVLIALLLILRIETKLDGLTSAVVQLSEAIKSPRGQLKHTRQMYVFMQFDEIVEKFLEDKKLEGRAPGTIEEYRFRLTEFGNFLNKNNIDFRELKSTDISAF